MPLSSNPQRPAALLLSPETPYPLHGGGALRTASVLNYLARDHDVDLIVFRHRADQDPIAALPPGLVRRTLVIDLPVHAKDITSRIWRNGLRYLRGVPPLVDRFRGFGDPIAEFVGGHRYQVSVIEHFWCAEYQPLLHGVSDAVVLNLHNVESLLHETSAVHASLGGFLHRRFARQCRILERQWLPQFAELLAASDVDGERIREGYPGSKPRLFPNSVPWTQMPSPVEENVVVFSGNLEYHPNQEAIAFFAGRIWPHLAQNHAALRWRLIGMNPEAVRGSLAHLPNVEFTGSVLDAVSQIAAAKVVVVPLLSGSGTRLKIIEAWAAGRAIVSTSLGAEGLPARHGMNILLADTAQEFISAVESLLANAELRRKLGRAGRQKYEEEFCWEAAWEALDSTWLAADSTHFRGA